MSSRVQRISYSRPAEWARSDINSNKKSFTACRYSLRGDFTISYLIMAYFVQNKFMLFAVSLLLP